jgi:hypothetical protein
MQVRPRILTIALIALATSVLLGACYGGDSGRVWFNLPSAKIHVQEDGTARAFGANLGPVVDPALVSQLAAADVDELEARIGYNGLHVSMNGEELPYVSWDATSSETLQGVLGSVQGVPPAAAQYLPWLRKIGLGAKLILPGGGNAPRWTGETTAAQDTPENTVGPINIGGIAFDESGNLVIGGLDTAALSAATGGALPQLPPNVLAMLGSLGIDSVNVNTDPNNLNLNLNGQPLPSIKYDSQRLGALTKYLPGLTGDPSMGAMLEQVTPLLQGLDLNADVSFTGEPIGELVLPAVDVTVGDDGSLNAFGMPLPGATLDAATIKTLQDANIQGLNLDVNADGLFAAVNGQTLPSISWNDESVGALAGIAAGAAGMDAGTVEGILGLIRGTGIQANLALPVGAGQTPVEIPAEIDRTIEPADLGDLSAPTIHLDATFDSSGKLTSLGTIGADDLSSLGVDLGIVLPQEVLDLLKDMNANELSVAIDGNKLNVDAAGKNILSIDHDAQSLGALVSLASGLAGDSPLSDPGIQQLLNDVILPMIPGSDIQINVRIE